MQQPIVTLGHVRKDCEVEGRENDQKTDERIGIMSKVKPYAVRGLFNAQNTDSSGRMAMHDTRMSCSTFQRDSSGSLENMKCGRYP